MEDWPVVRSLLTKDNASREKRRHAFMPRVGFEFTISVLEP
jgi:hypothetical protein